MTLARFGYEKRAWRTLLGFHMTCMGSFRVATWKRGSHAGTITVDDVAARNGWISDRRSVRVESPGGGSGGGKRKEVGRKVQEPTPHWAKDDDKLTHTDTSLHQKTPASTVDKDHDDPVDHKYVSRTTAVCHKSGHKDECREDRRLPATPLAVDGAFPS
jgi:hypothetical protein